VALAGRRHHLDVLSILNFVDAIAWVNGELVTPDIGALPYDDHGLVGDGAFEAIKVIGRRPFALARHLRRLVASATPLDIGVDLDRVHEAVAAVLATDAAAASPCWLRVTVTAGSAPMGSGGRGKVPSVVAAVAPMAVWGPAAAVVVLPWTRNERGPTAGLKTISYADNVIGLRYAHAHAADEGIFANTAGLLCEGTGSNVVVGAGGRLLTPTLASGCLAGVTRALLLEWLPDLVEEDIPIEALRSADEAFLTSTSRDVHPIRTIDGRSLGATPGPLTTEARRVFATRAATHNDP
jgi:branched-chain amino acid aminotransferase